MDTISVADARKAESVGKQVRLRGWVRTRRDSKGGFSFIELNDGSCQGNVQVVAPGELANYESVVKQLHTGASVAIDGEVKASPAKGQATEVLASRVEFPIPETLIEGETDALLRQLVEQNLRRGVPQEELEKNKEELYASARKAAIERTKVRLLLLRVAEAEKIQVERDDISMALYREASRNNQKPEKLAKELEKDRGRVQALHENILVDKALDFLVSKATVTAA